MKTNLLLFFLAVSSCVLASNSRYRVLFRADPSTTATIGWDQTGGSNPVVYYDVVDHGTNAGAYAFSKSVDRSSSYKGMNNHFARLTGLNPNTAYYFVIQDSQGTSQRFWFKTCPNSASERLSFIAGGDSRNNATPRRNANKLVAKLRPHAVFFGGDMTNGDSNGEWLEWMDDWQLTTGSDGRMIPIVAARGNHEGSNNSIYNLFDTPSSSVYYAITFGGNLVRTYTLNTEISISGSQTSWLNSDLAANSGVVWKMAQYHKPMRPHVSSKSEGNSQYSNWATPFKDNNVKLVIECDAHTVKTTWPVVPSTGGGSDEGFIRDDANGTIYAGEGCWGAPTRSNDDDKNWTRNSGRFNQFKWIFVDSDKIELRTIKVDNADQVGQVNDNDIFTPPANLDVWNPSNGSVVTIQNPGGNISPTVSLTAPSEGAHYSSAQFVTATANASDADGSVSKVEFLVDGNVEVTDFSAPYSASVYVPNGSHTITAKVYDDENATATDVVNVTAGAYSQTLETRIASGNDDVEENANGSMYSNSSDIELVYDGSRGNQTIGLRFTGVSIPQGASIDAAYIQFTCDETNSGSSSMTIRGEDVNNSSSFGSGNNEVSGRTKTSASASWSPSAWNSVGASTSNERTSEIKSIVQEIVDRGAWASGNAMTMIITGSGERTSEAYEGSSSSAALLHVEYTVGGGQTNQSPTVAITSPSNGAQIEDNIGNPLTISANASDPDGSVSSVEFYRNGSLIGTDNAAPYNFSWTITSEGNHTFTAKAIDNEGAETTSSGVTVTISEPSGGGTTETLDIRVSNGNDDAEERESGTVSLTSSDLEFQYDRSSTGNQTIGIRFRNVTIPQGATVTNAYIQFTVDETKNQSGTKTIRGEDVNNAAIYSSASGNVSSRATTSASINWNPPTWNSVGAAGADQQTPDVKSLVQEIVNRGGWNAGNSMAFVFTGTGQRCAESYNGSAGSAPLLHLEYETGGGTPNQSPIVSITNPSNGATITADLSDPLTLSATASDPDGSIASVDFYVNGTLVGSDNTSPYSYVWSINSFGSKTIEAIATDNLGATASHSISVTLEEDQGGTQSFTFEKQVATGSDDAEEAENGTMYLTSSDLELVYDSYQSAGDQEVGMRFTNITVPPGAIITNAYIEFTVDESTTGSCNVNFYGEDVNDASGFTSTANNISSRTKTSASVNWVPSGWSSVGSKQQSPDIKSIVQEIINRGGWSSGNDMVMIVTGTGKRTAESYNGSASNAALLHIEYDVSATLVLGMDAEVEGSISLFPNPVIDYVVVENEFDSQMDFKIIDAQGRVWRKFVMRSESSRQVDLFELPEGTYYVVAESENEREVKHFVKQ